MKMLRKLLLIGACVAVFALLIGCSGNKQPDESTGEATKPEESTAGTTGADSTAGEETTKEEESTEEETTSGVMDSVPNVSDEIVGNANVALRGFVMANALKDSGTNLYLNDGKTDAVFDSGALEGDGSFFIDLGTAYTVTAVRLHAAKGMEGLLPTAYEVQLSQDGKNYTTVATEKQASTADGILTVSFKAGAARYVRVVMTGVPTDADGVRHYALAEAEVMANITAKNNIDLYQDDMWIYLDTKAALRVDGYRVADAENPHYRYVSDDTGVVRVDENGNLEPVSAGDATVYVYDGKNLAACRVRVIDDSGTSFRISAFYHSNFIYPEYMAECLDYMKQANIGYLEETRTYDRNGNQVCDYMMFLCAERDIFYSVCDPIHEDTLCNAKNEDVVLDIIKKYENRAGFGGLYLTDEPHEESNSYANIAKIIQNYNRHLTAHLNLLPDGGFPSWQEYIRDYCAVAGTPGIRNRYLSYDNYCFLEGGGFNYGVYQTLYDMRKVGLMYNFDTGYYMQAMAIPGAYRVSSDTELRYNASMGVAYGMKNFKWFVYLTPLEGFTTGIIGPDFKPSSMYDGICTVNRRIAEIGLILGKSDAIEVYHTKAVYNNPALPDSFVLTQDSTYDAIFTLYRSYEDGQQYVVVTNKNYKPNGKCTFSLHAAADLASLEVYRDGKWETVSMQDGKFTEVIAAGDFALFRLPKGYDAAQKTEQSENLALNCPVYASTSSYDFWSASENAAYMLTDGVTDRGGYMAANSNFYRESPVLTLDLGSVRNFSRINLYGLPNNVKKTAKNIRIAYSVDGVNWTELSEVSEVGDKKEITFDAIDARYVRLTLGTKRAGLGEIEVYEK